MSATALKLTAAVTLMLAGASSSLQAQNDVKPINVVTTAVPFLRISPDARAGAMGELAIATNADASSSYFNIGKVRFNTSKAGVSVRYSPWLKNVV